MEKRMHDAQWVFVNSDNLYKISYSKKLMELSIVFINRKQTVYRYMHVPNKIWEQLKAAPSKGVFHSTYIKNSYQYLSG